MCGFAGEIANNRAADVAAVAAMTDTMVPRGPDAGGAYAQGPVALGHRRLSIIDLSPAGSQPMHDPELGLTIAFNGCIYNYPELRHELLGKGHRFFSHSDTEVLLKAYKEWGDRYNRPAPRCAFASIRRDSGRSAARRDRLGVRPSYLAESRRRPAFHRPFHADRGRRHRPRRSTRWRCHYLTFHRHPGPHV